MYTVRDKKKIYSIYSHFILSVTVIIFLKNRYILFLFFTETKERNKKKVKQNGVAIQGLQVQKCFPSGTQERGFNPRFEFG